MEQISLEAKKRTESGKIPARRGRDQGVIPAVIYGKKVGSIPLSMNVPELEKALAHGAAHKIVNLRITENGKNQEELCVIHEIQKDTFGKRVLHVDFRQISMEEKITSKVPIKLTGTPAGAKEGGILDHVLWEVEVKSLPMNLPEKLEVDVSGLLINQYIHVKDIKLPEGVEILESPEEVVAALHPPRAEEVVAPPAAEGVAAGTAAVPGTPAQPEVISKGKKEEEGAEEKPEKPEKAEKGKK